MNKTLRERSSRDKSDLKKECGTPTQEERIREEIIYTLFEAHPARRLNKNLRKRKKIETNRTSSIRRQAPNSQSKQPALTSNSLLLMALSSTHHPFY